MTNIECLFQTKLLNLLMPKDISIRIDANHLGPHIRLSAVLKVSSLQLGIFAVNGTGKTFISRPLRLITDKNPTIEDSNRLLTITEYSGDFQINITDINGERKAGIVFKRNNIPVITNES